MKILHINYSDTHGGAARAAYRIHKSLIDKGIDSRIWVNKSVLDDWTIVPPKNKFYELIALIRPKLVELICKLLKTQDKVLLSPSILPSFWLKSINESDADIVNLHWVQGEMLSISDIAKIKKPIVWTLHDMWAFCGAEHLSLNSRWKDGYSNQNRPKYEKGFDLNKWTWKRKIKYWQKPLQIVTPSYWLGDCVKNSFLMQNWPIDVIPNPIDIEKWKPVDKIYSRDLLMLPQNKKLLIFGAVGGSKSSNKGFDLLLKALTYLFHELHFTDLELVVFGELKPKNPMNFEYPIHYLGHLYDDFSLCALYSAADALVVPSRQESFCQAASEAHSCGTPVIAFKIGGLKDIVSHKITGYLAKDYDIEDLAIGIKWVLMNNNTSYLKDNCRNQVIDKFQYNIVSNQYMKIYNKVLNTSKNF
jgi:glycosyltransferase involved in cell wall biosynthesis